MLHLDTSFLIRSLDPQYPEAERLRAWIAEGETFHVSTFAWAEFLCGPIGAAALESVVQIISQLIDFTPSDADTAAELFNQTGRRRGTFADCMIAAVALAERAPICHVGCRRFRPV